MNAYADNEVMTPFHPDWEEFIEALALWVNENGCRAIKRAHPGVWCVLHRMGWSEESITLTRGYLLANGGGCDCEVLMNCE